jgi:anaerobic selenocysteine-containing dehydrogenase
MSKPNSDTKLDRRGFLKGIGTGAAGAATVAAGVGAASPVFAAENAADKRKVRYRESDHVKKYYATNRY